MNGESGGLDSPEKHGYGARTGVMSGPIEADNPATGG
jgi:hypothetical protein